MRCFSVTPSRYSMAMKALPALLADVVNRADVRMVQRRSRLRLALKAGQRLRIARNIVGQELQSHEAVQSRVLCLVDHTHPAAAQLLDECGNAKWSGRSWQPMLGVHLTTSQRTPPAVAIHAIGPCGDGRLGRLSQRKARRTLTQIMRLPPKVLHKSS